jgi:hypothetical protein
VSCTLHEVTQEPVFVESFFSFPLIIVMLPLLSIHLSDLAVCYNIMVLHMKGFISI